MNRKLGLVRPARQAQPNIAVVSHDGGRGFIHGVAGHTEPAAIVLNNELKRAAPVYVMAGAATDGIFFEEKLRGKLIERFVFVAVRINLPGGRLIVLD